MKDYNKYIYMVLTVIALALFGYYEYSLLIDHFDGLRIETSHNSEYYKKNSEKFNVCQKDDVNKADVTFTLNAKAALLLDATTNRVLFEKKGYDQMAMASTTKIMTCIVALENGNLDDVVTFSKKAASMPDVQLNAKTGEQFYLRDLLYSLMLESHNDTAVAIAEHIGGSVEGFADLMNEKARELGCMNTNFVTPNGLDAPGHYTTAYDLARIASYAIKNEDFLTITNTPAREFATVDSKRSFGISNKDRFLYLMDGAIGVKTGFTNNAGYCFVGALKRDGKTFVSVVLGCGWPPNKSYKWKDTQNLMQYGINNYEYQDITVKEMQLLDIPVPNGKTKHVYIDTTDVDLNVLVQDDDCVQVEYMIEDSLMAPIYAGDQVGVVNYYINNLLYKEVPVVALNTVEKKDLRYCFDEILDRFLMGN